MPRTTFDGILALRKKIFYSALLLLLPFWDIAAQGPACPAQGLKVGYFQIAGFYHNGNGCDVDLVHELAKRLNCLIIEEHTYPRIRTLMMLEQGKINVGTSTLQSSERERYAWIYPYFHSKNMTLLSRSINAKSKDELLNHKKLRWGVIRGYRYGEEQDAFLSQLEKRNKLVIVNTEENLYMMLAKGRIHAAFAYPKSYDNWLKNNPILTQRITVTDIFPGSEVKAVGLALAHSHFSKQQAELWETELQKMYRDGTLRNIFRRFFTEITVQHMLAHWEES